MREARAQQFYRFSGTPRALLGVSFCILAAKAVLQLAHPIAFAWDATVYTGMAQYLATHGVIGMWEFFRPPALPLLFALGPLLHIPVILWAKLLTFVAALSSLFLIFKIGERYHAYAGAVAALILSGMALFTDFILTPTTEIFGICFFLFSFYVLFVQRRYYWGGVLTGILFAIRYPYGLLFAAYAAGIVAVLVAERAAWKHIIRKLALYMLGVGTIFIPYLVANAILYRNPFAPVMLGTQVIAHGNALYREPILYYFALTVLACPAVLFIYRAWKSDQKTVAVLWYVAFTMLGYFTLIGNKQDRFLLHAMPALILLTSLGAVRLIEKKRQLAGILALLIAVELVFPYHSIVYTPRNTAMEAIYRSYEGYPSGTDIVSSSPLIAQYAPIKITPMYTYWRNDVVKMLESAENKGKPFYLNVCDIIDPEDVKRTILRYGTIEQERVVDGCVIYTGKIL